MTIEQVAAEFADPTRDRGAMDDLVAAFTGLSGPSPKELGGVLRRHRLTGAVLEILDGIPRTLAEITEVLPRCAITWTVRSGTLTVVLTEVGGHEQGQPQPSGSAEFLGLIEIARGGPVAVSPYSARSNGSDLHGTDLNVIDGNGLYDGPVATAVDRLGQWGSNRTATEDAARISRTARV
ncbi:hypothetical protein [Streptomyces sp. NBC_01643]|uniref:hypothetical protein n=1 Tax=Streptomyces sp. NBC_01643 TaxID=2975906 RepID=UPI0038708722|nr:hypothetical protein OHB03_06770 [Streptomyces sp. NBC_01643]